MKLFIAGSSQSAGKTMLALGLLPALRQRWKSVGFIKPVGPHWVEVGDERVEEDAQLVKVVFDFPDDVKDMNPVTVEAGLTRKYIGDPDPEQFKNSINDAFNRIAHEKDVVLIEGTGHAGVGSVLDLSNARVARRLGAPVVLVVPAGIGHSIDETWLNQCVFEREGVTLLGVVLNRCREDGIDEIADDVRKGLARKGIELLGILPHSDLLSAHSVLQLVMALKADLLSGHEGIGNSIRRIVVGAMGPHRALDAFSGNTLLITPGEREDLILAALSTCVLDETRAKCVSAIMLTGGVKPHPAIIKLMQKASIPVMLVEHDCYTAAGRVYDLVSKIRPTDTKKISLCRRLVHRHVNVERVIECMRAYNR